MKSNSMGRSPARVGLAWLLLWSGILPLAWAAVGNPPRSTARLLVDLARHHGLCCGGSQTPADVLHIRTLLRAAIRLDPAQASAYVWLYELAAREGRWDEATGLLGRLVEVDPTNITAFGNWLELAPRDLPTIEQRRAWLEQLLAEEQEELGGAADHARRQRRALLHTHLARVALLQADWPRARLHIDRALVLWPECPDAVRLQLDLLTRQTPPAERLGALLQALRTNPLHADLAWEIGLLLDDYDFAEEAKLFYDHALDVHRTAGSAAPLPPEKLVQLSRNALARQEREAAVRYAQDAAAAESLARSDSFLARFHWYWILSVGGEATAQVAQRFKARLAREFAAIQDPAGVSVELVAQAAWFYCMVDRQPLRALELAQEAARRAPGDPFVMRVLGWAQALNGQTAAARRTLTPLASADAYAAYRLASLLRDAGEDAAAEKVLADFEGVAPAGWPRALLAQLGVTPASQPAEQRYPRMAAVLAGFDRTVLELHRQPTRFFQAAIEVDDPSLFPGEPWWAAFTLTNRADFPITLGPDWTLNPVFLLSFHSEGDRERDYPHLMTVSLDHVRVIPPGQAVTVRQTLDVGPVRNFARQTPQQLQSVTITALVDPEQTPDGQWQAGVTGGPVRPASLVRLPANTTPEAWHARFSALRAGPGPDCFKALEVMAELLGEYQRARAAERGGAAGTGSAYRPAPIPLRRVHQALCAALSSESWEIRVRALDALQIAGLDRRLLNAAENCLEHPHWLVRLMAVRLLARQGAAFAGRAREIAANDPDELVRDLARSYVLRWSPPASAPSTRPTTQAGR